MTTRFPGTHRHATLLLAWMGAAALGAPSVPAEIMAESFEDGVPAYVRASRPDSLSTSETHSKHGRHSLCWEWQAGDALTIRHGLGDIRRQGGYGGTYSKATFGVWVHVRQPDPGALTFGLRAPGEPEASFLFPLDFTGWRRAHLRLSWQPQFDGTVSPRTDTIVIHAPRTGRGRVHIDLLVYNGILDYRQQHVPGTSRTARPEPDLSLFPVPDALAAAEMEGLRLVEDRLQREAVGSQDVTPELLAELEREVAEWNLQTAADGTVRGRPFVRYPGFYTEVGLQEVHGPREIGMLMRRIAAAHGNCSDAAGRDRLAKWFLLLADHTQEQGMVAGAGFPWGWYDGRDLATAIFAMRDVLRAAGRLDSHAAYFDENYGFSRIFDDATLRPNMDYFHNDLRNMMRGALLQPDEAARVRALRALSRRLTMDILQVGPDGFRPDGSAFHHQMHYFAYANYSTNTLCGLLDFLGGTPFQVEPAALERVKQAIMAMRFTCNHVDLPLPLCGRHPHSQALGTGKFLALAKAMAGPDGAPERELAAAYLRFAPEAPEAAALAAHGIVAEPHPSGCLVMPHAGLMAVRRDHWLMLVKGYSRYARYGEIYAGNNRFGRYLGNGYLDILAGGIPVNRADSGCTAPGWDWNRLDGTTVIVLPTERLRAVSRGTEFIPTDEVFCGGAAHPSGSAVFGLALRGGERHDPSFRARKSYHWLSERGAMVCLGSDIACDDPEHPVQTTLFQKAVGSPRLPVLVNAAPLADRDSPLALPAARTHWLTDVQGTGYVVPAGQSLSVSQGLQQHRDHQDRAETEGHFACAWLDHGKAPRQGTYHYAVLPAALPEGPARLAAALDEGQADAYRVVTLDAAAHAVVAPAPGGARLSAACFAPGRLEAAVKGLPAIAVDTPCLLIAQTTGSRLAMAIADPDLRLGPDYRSETATLTVTVDGVWSAAQPLPGNADIAVVGNQTRVMVATRDAATTTVTLQPGTAAP